MDAAVKRLGHSAQIAGMRLSAMIKAVSQDTEFLTHTKAVDRIVQMQGESESGTGGLGWKDDLADIFSAMLESQPSYHQIRLLEMQDEAREIVRVERVNGHIKRMPAHRTPEEPLRRYFEASAGRAGNGFYLSRLQRERGRLGEPRTPSVSAARRRLHLLVRPLRGYPGDPGHAHADQTATPVGTGRGPTGARPRTRNGTPRGAQRRDRRACQGRSVSRKQVE